MRRFVRGRPARRLLVLLLLSLLLHALGLQGLVWLGMRAGAGRAGPAPLRIRLRGAAPAAAVATPARAAPPPPAPTQPPAQPPAQAARAAPAPAFPPAPAAPPDSAGAATPAAPGPAGVAPVSLGLPLAGPATPPADAQPVRRASTTLPPSARLDYVTTRTGTPAWAASGSARLDWQIDGASRYTLSFSASGAGAHVVRSSGTRSDDGIEPDLAEDSAAAAARVRFDRAGGRIAFAGGAAAPLAANTQDALSVLMELSGIVAASAAGQPEQVDLRVAAAGAVQVVRFVRVGAETLDLPAGRMETVHFAQLADAGSARLDVWLAPAHAWLPAQLQTTDGARVTTHRLSSTAP